MNTSRPRRQDVNTAKAIHSAGRQVARAPRWGAGWESWESVLESCKDLRADRRQPRTEGPRGQGLGRCVARKLADDADTCQVSLRLVAGVFQATLRESCCNEIRVNEVVG